MRRKSSSTAGVLSLFFMVLPTISASAGAESPPLAAYVLLGESSSGETAAYARIVTDSGLPCPVLIDPKSGATTATQARKNPAGFTVQVCEARYPFGKALRVAGGPTLPAVSADPKKLAVFGDSGCKPSSQAGCTMDDPAWPFPQVAAAAAKSPPDLVIHVGDYNYRGTPSSFKGPDGQKIYYYDAGDGAPASSNCGLSDPYTSQNSSGNPDADTWQSWWLDFFQPAAPLLSAAPWVFARGNHELCSHAGPGFLYFLDTASDLPGAGGQRSCPPQDPGGEVTSHLILLPPQVLRLGQLELLLVDSANACDQQPGLAAEYRKQFDAVADKLKGTDSFFVSHRPIWGIDGDAEALYDCNNQPIDQALLPYGQLNTTLQCALNGPAGAKILSRLGMILAGHMHRFEALSFAPPSHLPPTLIVGMSGVAEETGKPIGAISQVLDDGTAIGVTVEEFGYVELERDPVGGWNGRIRALAPAAWSPYFAACTGNNVSLCVSPLP